MWLSYRLQNFPTKVSSQSLQNQAETSQTEAHHNSKTLNVKLNDK